MTDSFNKRETTAEYETVSRIARLIEPIAGNEPNGIYRFQATT